MFLRVLSWFLLVAPLVSSHLALAGDGSESHDTRSMSIVCHADCEVEGAKLENNYERIYRAFPSSSVDGAGMDPFQAYNSLKLACWDNKTNFSKHYPGWVLARGEYIVPRLVQPGAIRDGQQYRDSGSKRDVTDLCMRADGTPLNLITPKNVTNISCVCQPWDHNLQQGDVIRTTTYSDGSQTQETVAQGVRNEGTLFGHMTACEQAAQDCSQH